MSRPSLGAMAARTSGGSRRRSRGERLLDAATGARRQTGRDACGHADRRHSGPGQSLGSAAQPPVRGEPPALRRPCRHGGCLDPRPAGRDRRRSPGSVRAVGPGASAVHLRLPRRADHRVGLSVVPAGTGGPDAVARDRRDYQCRVRRLSRLACSRRTGGGPRRDPGALPHRQRRVQPNALLAATCLAVLLVDPWAALDLGGWLSAAALWGASRFTRWSDRALGTGFWARTTFSSLGATLATAPITAAFLGTVALAGLLLNFPAIPLAALAVPGVLASLLRAAGVARWRGGARGGLRTGPSPAGAVLPPRVRPCRSGTYWSRRERSGRCCRGWPCWAWRSGCWPSGIRSGRPVAARAGRSPRCCGLGSRVTPPGIRRLTAVEASRYIFSTWGRATVRYFARRAAAGS